MIHRILVIIFICMPAFLFSQPKDEKKSETQGKTTIPVLSQYSKNFKLHDVNFSKRSDFAGKGEVLEVEMRLTNLTDDPADLYIFVIATYEIPANKSSLSAHLTEKDRMKTFSPFPNDLKNFDYPDTDEKGNVKKEISGADTVKYLKFPKNTKAGIDPVTGKAYTLNKLLVVRTTHLSNYKLQFYFFNQVTIIVFDSEGKPVYRQKYELTGTRR